MGGSACHTVRTTILTTFTQGGHTLGCTTGTSLSSMGGTVATTSRPSCMTVASSSRISPPACRLPVTSSSARPWESPLAHDGSHTAHPRLHPAIHGHVSMSHVCPVHVQLTTLVHTTRRWCARGTQEQL